MIFEKPEFLPLALLIPAGIFFFIKSGKRGPRERTSTILRFCAILALVVSIAGLQTVKSAEQVNMIFILDMSDSVPEYMRREALDHIKRQIKNMSENDTCGLILFGEGPSIEFTPRNLVPEIEISSIVSKKGSDIGKAIYTAMGTFPDAGENRLTIFSDGLETKGNALQAARIAARSGISIFTVPLGSLEILNECYIDKVAAPFTANINQTHKISVYINSTIKTETALTFFKDGEYMGETSINLDIGENVFTYSSSLESKGPHSYEIIMNPLDDTIQENNYYNQIVHVIGASSVLYVHQENKVSSSFLNSLRTQKYDVDSVDSYSLPSTFSEIVQYDAIIFDNVPAYDLSFSKMELIESYVRNTGGGFFMIGGDSSFGIGGYFKTPIEKMLPVDMDVSSSLDIPSMTLLMIIDKSGSMRDRNTSGQTKLDLVKEAVLAAVETLNPYYHVGCITFDSDFEWALEDTEAGNTEEIFQKIAEIDTGGGTILYPPLEEAYQFFSKSESAVKHLIILSDGLTESADFQKIIEALNKKDVTVSTVAIGGDADKDLMKEIAEWGEGRSYYTADIRNVPRIFASETLIASRGIMVDLPFIPILENDDEVLKNIDRAFPPLGGFVLTYKKDGAKQILSTINDNPLLSIMQYGLGRTAAFTSSFDEHWAEEWLYWNDFPRFVSQLTRGTVRAQTQKDMYVSITKEGANGRLTLDAISGEGIFMNDLDLKTIFITADGTINEDRVPQTAPGLYEYDFTINGEGEYFFTVFNEKQDMPLAPRTYAYAVPYSAEYVPKSVDLKYLASVSSEANGRLIELPGLENENLFEAAGTFQRTLRRIWPLTAILALLLFIIDIAVRKQIFPQEFLKTLLYRIKSNKNKKYSYEEVREIINEKDREEREKNKLKRRWFEDKSDSLDISARLYLARKKRKE